MCRAFDGHRGDTDPFIATADAGFHIHLLPMDDSCYFNPIALRKAKTLWSFGCSECNKVKLAFHLYFSPREMASLVKQIPTCAGLPLNMTVRANTFYYVSTQLSADVTEYLQKTGPLTADWTFAGLYV